MKFWFRAAAALAFASVVMGTIVCATESGAACPNWPGCYNEQFAPVLALNPMIEFVHRVVAALTGPTVLVAALLGRRLPDARPRRLAWVGLVGTILAGLFGMLIVKLGIPWWLGVLDLASALVATVALLWAALLLEPGQVTRADPVSRLAWAGLGCLLGMHLLALAVAGDGSATRCLGWPLGVFEADRWAPLQAVRLLLAVAALGLLLAAIRLGLGRAELRLASGLVLVGLAAEFGFGCALLAGAEGLWLAAGFGVAAATIFGGAALLAILAGLRPAEDGLPGSAPASTATRALN